MIVFVISIFIYFIVLFFIPYSITYEKLNIINKKKTKIIMSVSFSIVGIILNVILIKLALKIVDIILNNEIIIISESARLLPIIMVFGWSFVFLYLLMPMISKFVCNKLFKFNYRKEDKNEENI